MIAWLLLGSMSSYFQEWAVLILLYFVHWPFVVYCINVLSWHTIVCDCTILRLKRSINTNASVCCKKHLWWWLMPDVWNLVMCPLLSQQRLLWKYFLMLESSAQLMWEFCNDNETFFTPYGFCSVDWIKLNNFMIHSVGSHLHAFVSYQGWTETKAYPVSPVTLTK